jgi:hypothetical protein
MQQNSVFQKSDKGSQAIAKRDHALVPKLRSMLILVDGKRPVEELAKLSAALGDTQQLLAQLLEQGYIEDAATQAAPAAAPGAQGAAPVQPPAQPPITLAEAQRFAVRKLTDLMGPAADDLCMRIEATRTAAEFHAVIKRAETMLRDLNGAAAATAFAQQIESHSPG